jgi:DNA polymerase I-like protein with 3'-5' exonuclease and polymerase domains
VEGDKPLLINIDIKGLEWVTVVWFAQDKVGMHEILTGVDQHAENQTTFGLPERRIAKIFVFRLIYGGTAWAYVFDPDFNWISKDAKWWQKVIDKFYDKYRGINEQHNQWVREAVATGRLVMPTGRFYEFAPKPDKRGELKWPRTQILNYPVQGTGHDIVTITRVSLAKRIKAHEQLASRCLFVSTVHDSIVLDVQFTLQDAALVRELVSVVHSVMRDVPDNFRSLFGVEFNLPIQCEISAGDNLLETVDITK